MAHEVKVSYGGNICRAIFAVFVTLSALTATSKATLTVSATGTYQVTSVGANLYDVTILTNGASPGTFHIWTNDSNDRIRNLVCQTVGSSVDTVVYVEANGAIKVKSVQHVFQTGSSPLTVSRIDTSEDIGDVTAVNIGTLEAGRDIVGPVTATASGGTVGITTAKATRNIVGTVSAPNGRIGFIEAANIGQSGGSLVRIEAKYSIQQILVLGQLLHADIESGVNSGTLANTGLIGKVLTPEFDGKIVAKAIVTVSSSPPQFYFDNSFTGSITIRGSFLPQASPLRFIQTPVAGLSGQILINTDNGGGTWSGPVKVGPDGNPSQVILSSASSSAPYYAYTSASLGGGFVGLVPFNLHTQDSAFTAPQFSGGTLRLRFYGPIANSSPSTIPVIVEAMFPSGSGWDDVSSYFSHSISGRDLTLTAIANVVDPASDSLVTLRVRPRAQLTCSPSVMTGGATAPTVYTFDWQFVP